MPSALLAFSGGLDTSFCIPYLQEKGFDVITLTVNTGGFSPQELKKIKNQAKKLGAVKHYEVDAKKTLYDQFASYLIKANYLKGGAYPACVGPERNVIALEMAKIAHQEKINVVVHGSTGAGNDQVRFDVAFRALIPNAKILVPIRDENLTRQQEADFLKKHGFKVPAKTTDYSINVGLLGTTLSGKETLDTLQPLPDEIFPSVKSLTKTPNTASELTINFQKGLPVSLNKHKIDGVTLIQKLNRVADEHGFGRDYHIGTTIIGLKGKIGFEAPALKILIKAKSELEKIILTSKQLFWKNHLGQLYGDLIHEGLYFDPLVKNLEAFFDSANNFVTGEVKVKLFKGTLEITSLNSTYSLFNSRLGTYGEKASLWTGQDAKGFCTLYGLESINAYLTQK